MSTTPTKKSGKQILKELFQHLNLAAALRRRRCSNQDTGDAFGTPSGRRALQNSIVILDVAFSIAETIPIVGQPLKGALEALCKILKLVELKFQITDGITKLTERLNTLMKFLSQFKEPESFPLEQLTARLLKVGEQLQALTSKKGVRYPAIAQALRDSEGDVNATLNEFTALAQVTILENIRILKAERVATECVTVLDPFGLAQKIQRIYMDDIELVGRIVLHHYSPNPKMKQALKSYVAIGMYELTLDDGNRIQTLTNTIIMSAISQGSTVLMRIVIQEHLGQRDVIECPTCRGSMPVSQAERVVCPSCERRVSAMAGASHTSISDETTPKAAQNSLFCNITIRYTFQQPVASASRISVAQHLPNTVTGTGAQQPSPTITGNSAQQATPPTTSSSAIALGAALGNPLPVVNTVFSSLFGDTATLRYDDNEDAARVFSQRWVCIVRIVPMDPSHVPTNIGFGSGSSRVEARKNAASAAMSYFLDNFRAEMTESGLVLL